MSGGDKLLKGVTRALEKRNINLETAKKFGTRVAWAKWVKVDGKNQLREAEPKATGAHPVLAFDYHDASGAVVAQKVRFKDKDFTVLGDLKKAALFGQHLWRDSGKKVVITEGEIDALSVSQLQGNKWPVVSIPTGAGGARKALQKALDWLEAFDEVILMFDQDEAGREAVAECAPLFSPGKCKVASLPLKDANECLMKGKGKDVIDAMWGAKVYRPDGIVSFAEIMDDVLKPVEMGDPWPWEWLTKQTFGRRDTELYALGAGTGVGKTDWFTQVIAHDVLKLGKTCGVIYLEQPNGETGKRLAGKVAGKRFHVPDGSWEQEELDTAARQLLEADRLFLFNHFGETDWDIIKQRIRYMVVALGVQHVFLDHLTALAAGVTDERVVLEGIMAEMAALAQELKFKLHFISHLATPEGKSHEEGGRVTIRQFKGSRAIGYWSHFMFALERNQQDDDEAVRHTSTFRILKDRNTGQSTGKTCPLAYDHETGLLDMNPDNPFTEGAPPAGESF